MIPQHTPAKPVILSVAEWTVIMQALSYMPGVIAGPIIAAVQAQQQEPKADAV